MNNEVRKDYGPRGCAGSSIALATVATLLLSLAGKGAKRAWRGAR